MPVSHTHGGCDDLSGLVSLLTHLAPSKSLLLTEADISCPKSPCRGVVLVPRQRYCISSHFWRCNVYSEQSEGWWEPLLPLIIHQCVVLVYLFTFIPLLLPDIVLHASRVISPCFHFHFWSTSASLCSAHVSVLLRKDADVRYSTSAQRDHRVLLSVLRITWLQAKQHSGRQRESQRMKQQSEWR